MIKCRQDFLFDSIGEQVEAYCQAEKHHCPAVATKRILEQPCHLGISWAKKTGQALKNFHIPLVHCLIVTKRVGRVQAHQIRIIGAMRHQKLEHAMWCHFVLSCQQRLCKEQKPLQSSEQLCSSPEQATNGWCWPLQSSAYLSNKEMAQSTRKIAQSEGQVRCMETFFSFVLPGLCCWSAKLAQTLPHWMWVFELEDLLSAFLTRWKRLYVGRLASFTYIKDVPKPW